MRETIARSRDVLIARMAVLEEEIRLAEALYKERHGDFHYVTLENAALFERQLHSVHRLKELFQAADLEAFETTGEFKDFVLSSLQQLYDQRTLLRSGIRMIMECVRDL